MLDWVTGAAVATYGSQRNTTLTWANPKGMDQVPPGHQELVSLCYFDHGSPCFSVLETPTPKK